VTAGLAIFVLVCWIGILVQTILNITLVSRLDRNAVPSRTPAVSIIVPARNEADIIHESVRAFLAQDYPDLEVIVVNDRSTDTTGEIVQRIGKTDSRVILINGEEPPPGWLGKPWALHQGASVARGEFFLFVDADLIYAPAAVRSAMAFLLKHEAGSLSWYPRMVMKGFWENILMPCLAVIGFMELPTWLANRSRSPRLGIGGGPGTLVSRDLYFQSGGHEALRNAIIDDVGLVRQIRRTGNRTMILLADDLASLRMYRGLREIVEGFTKNSSVVFDNNVAVIALMLVLGVLVHIWPYALALAGLIHWLRGVPIGAVATIGIVTVVLITVARMMLFVWLRYRLDNAVLGHPLMFAVILYVLARSAWKVAILGQVSWRGRTYPARGLTFGGESRSRTE
jgi:chlorobactene glucosyltransferase